MKGIRHYFRLLAEDKYQGIMAGFLCTNLKTASKIYCGCVRLRKALYDRKILKSRKLPFPVISVGNLTWGGSGKTPLVEYLVRRVSEMHKTPLILTRGYSHDEVEQYKEHLPRVLIGVGKNRWETAQRMQKQHRIDVAILDDGFQHWAVERDADIVTINSLNPFGNEELIPRGPLREPLEALKRAQAVVLTHVNLAKPETVRRIRRRVNEAAPQAGIVESYLEPLFFYRARKRQRIPLEKLQNQRVTTFSAVGVPRSFQLILSHRHIKPIRNFEYTDHHMFSVKDLKEIKSVSEASASHEIVTTEKDFFRAPDKIVKILDPLVLAAQIRISAGEDILNGILSRLLGAKT